MPGHSPAMPTRHSATAAGSPPMDSGGAWSLSNRECSWRIRRRAAFGRIASYRASTAVSETDALPAKSSFPWPKRWRSSLVGGRPTTTAISTVPSAGSPPPRSHRSALIPRGLRPHLNSALRILRPTPHSHNTGTNFWRIPDPFAKVGRPQAQNPRKTGKLAYAVKTQVLF